ncbi:uncharacterized protein MONBRDRAFT_24126 [Monosiga brevicollis MX1]|uniref:Protein kinase domain-containing protein n=1 Tax=Monosiga brevicollis TaxID=81824 RepID=A9UVG4_MONBE|nr:uncharacterized protein MONBRDRAFT_24126 [Monosiga brevicollis MX1]EDQ90394.1 predicted protein [Monosiga brevicollis MX1]|eukprot:XP_001744445.1 hypothetical protein [Monosiga brevicollis MX1]
MALDSAFADLAERLKGINLDSEATALMLNSFLKERQAEREREERRAEREREREERNAVLECLVQDFAPPQGYNLVKHLASMSVDDVSFLYTLCKKNRLTCDQLENYVHIPEHKWTPKGASLPTNVEAKVPKLPPSGTRNISDINDNVREKFHFGIVQLPPSCHYLALEIVQRAQELLSANLPQEGIHTNLLCAYTNACLTNEVKSHEPHFSSLITLALQDHFIAPALAATSAQVAVSCPSETEPLADTTASTLATKQASVRNPIYLVHQASLGSANMHADWVGFDVLLRPVIVGECKMSAQHFDEFGGQVANEVVRLGLLGPKYQMRKDRQHPLHPFININVCGDIVTAYLVLHLTSNYRKRSSISAFSEPFPCPARGMAGWTCKETYGPNVQQYVHDSAGSWVIKHYDYWGRQAESLGTTMYQIGDDTARLPPSRDLLRALAELPETGKFYQAWVLEDLATSLVLLRYPRVQTAPCGLQVPMQLIDVMKQMQVLHKLDLVHGDILQRNILFCNSWQPEDWMFQPPSWEKKEKEEEEEEEESQHSPEAQSGNVTPCQSRQPSHDELSLKDLVVEAVAEEETVQTQQRPKPMAFLIDFDLGGPCDEATYGPGYNYQGGLEKYRHANARPGERLQKEHDTYSLARVAEDLLEDNDARKRLVRALEAVKLDEAIKLCRACTGRSGRG